jgi:splicing factor 3A subunit 3
LNIPSSPHFLNITKIDEAEALWKKLQHEEQKHEFTTSLDEEVEDSQGNIYSRKVYDLLAKQGLV